MDENRQLLSADELTDHLNGMLHEYEDTENCRFRGVQWHEPDDTGCNWESTFLDGDVTDYVIAVAGQVEARARGLYNLDE